MAHVAVRAAGLLLAVVLLASSAATAAVTYKTPYDYISKQPNLKIGNAVASALGLVATLKDPKTAVTILLPTDAAFGPLLSKLGLTQPQLLADKTLLGNLLSYHTFTKPYKSTDFKDKAKITTFLTGQTVTISVTGGVITFNGVVSKAKPVTANIVAGKSILHIVDAVLIPDVSKGYKGCKSPIKVLQDAKLNAAVGIVASAGLTAQYSNPKFAGTIFAPTDKALNDLVKKTGKTVKQLSADKKNLVALFNYHTTPVRYYSPFLTNKQSLPTLLNKLPLTVDLTSKKGSVVIKAAFSTATVTTADLLACSAVVHIVDTVLLPAKI